MLADCGAELIKVEPLTGDYMRFRSPVRNGRSSYFGQMNCGKKSIAIDLKSDKGREIARKLIATADVVVENYRPGVMHDLGLGYEDLKDEFPDLVYCSISGFGQKGSRARDPAYAPIIHAASGLDMTHMRWNKHLNKPPNTGVFTADAIAAVYAFGAIQTALIHRLRNGGGQHIDVNLLDATLNVLIFEFQSAQFPVEEAFRPLYEPLRARDGFVMVAPVNQNNFENLSEVVGHPEWKTDERFSTPRAREKNWKELMSNVEKWTQEHGATECEQLLMRAGVPASRFKTVDDLVADPELRASGAFAEVRDGSGSYLVPNQPFKFSASPIQAKPWVSDVGADGEDILRSIGVADAEIRQLEASRVIGK